jgi:FkbM family methyltransferase
VLIYGAGGGGSVTLDLLRKYSIKPSAFLDIQAEQIKQKDGTPVYHPSSCSVEDSLREKAFVLLAITLRARERHQIMADLRTWGYKNVVDAQEYNALAIGFSDGADTDWNRNADNILHARDLMADEESIATYAANSSAHMLRDYSACPETDEELQYFLKRVPFSKGLSRFIDCGAYNGDTLKTLTENCGLLEAYAGFEPFLPLYEKLALQAGQLSEKIKCCLLFPCAVGNRNATATLNDGTPGSAGVVNGGSIKIPVVRIDDALKVFEPTFLKMDIEGAEYDALLGARNTIVRCRPDLAVSVYHAINHLWDIPLLIDSWNLGYRFYLRAHSSATMETVLYAVND